MVNIHTEVVIDKNQKTAKAVIYTDKISAEVETAKRLLESEDKINCYDGDSVIPILQYNIIRVYTEVGKVYVQTADGIYLYRERLYNLENRLNKALFVRISKSEIVNGKKIIRFNIKMTGTIGIELENNIMSFVSRRYVPIIKSFFGL